MSAGRHVFIGGRDRGLTWLRRLAERRQLPAAVFALREDDHEAEKHGPKIVDFCREHGIPCQPRKSLKAEQEDEIRALTPDLIVVMGWRTLISDRVLAAARRGTVGLHESLLPAYRGFAPVNWAVINGETQTGVSLFHITATGIDDGDVVAQAVVPIGDHDTAGDVYRATSKASLELLDVHFDQLLAGGAPRTPQDESGATYTCSRTPEDGAIDWARSTREIHNLVRGLAHPYPGAFSHLAGVRYRIWSGRAVANPRRFVGRIPGRIVSSGPNGVEVLTGDGSYLVNTAGEDGRDAVPAQMLFKSVRSGFSGPAR
jgi:methionyl-tRNA formyltransferase